MGNLGCLTQVWHSSRKSSATHSYQCVQYFRVSKQWYGCQRLGFLTWTQTQMHAIAHGGCTDTVKESAPAADSGRKIPCRTRGLNPCHIAPGVFLSWTLYQLSCPHTPSSDSTFFVLCFLRSVGCNSVTQHQATAKRARTQGNVCQLDAFISCCSLLLSTHCTLVTCASK